MFYSAFKSNAFFLILQQYYLFSFKLYPSMTQPRKNFTDGCFGCLERIEEKFFDERSSKAERDK